MLRTTDARRGEWKGVMKKKKGERGKGGEKGEREGRRRRGEKKTENRKRKIYWAASRRGSRRGSRREMATGSVTIGRADFGLFCSINLKKSDKTDFIVFKV